MDSCACHYAGFLRGGKDGHGGDRRRGTPFSENYRFAGGWTVRGTYDPAHPERLFGSEVTGELDTIRTTIRWDLRFVVPKPN